MISYVANKIIKCFEKEKIIKMNDVDIYFYGLELLISELISTSVLLSIAMCTKCVLETVFYLVVFTILRIYAGGYHASSYYRCIFIFNSIFVCLKIILKWLQEKQCINFLILITIISIIIIFILAPVEDKNKPLEKKEFIVYQKKARKRILILGFSVIIIYIFINELKHLMIYGMLAIFEISMLLLVGSFKNYILDLKLNV